LTFVILIILLLESQTSKIFATIYYVDATNGDDNNSGTSPATAWKTIDHVNDEMEYGVISNGDDILFKRGSMDKERWYIK